MADAFLLNIPNDLGGVFGKDSTPATRIAKGESAAAKLALVGLGVWKGITWLF